MLKKLQPWWKIFIFMGTTLTKNLLFLLYIYALPIYFTTYPTFIYVWLLDCPCTDICIWFLYIQQHFWFWQKNSQISYYGTTYIIHMYYWIFWLELKFTFILFPKPTLRLAKISLSSTNNFEAWKALYY